MKPAPSWIVDGTKVYWRPFEGSSTSFHGVVTGEPVELSKVLEALTDEVPGDEQHIFGAIENGAPFVLVCYVAVNGESGPMVPRTWVSCSALRDAFDDATFYDGRDSDRYSSTELGEELEAIFDEGYDPNVPLREQIEAVCPLEILGYVNDTVTASHVAQHVRFAVDEFEEFIEEEYGGDGPGEVLSEAAKQRLRDALQVAFLDATKDAKVWQCKRSGSRTFNADEVEALLREACPSWFEDQPTASASDVESELPESDEHGACGVGGGAS